MFVVVERGEKEFGSLPFSIAIERACVRLDLGLQYKIIRKSLWNSLQVCEMFVCSSE